MIFVSMVIEAQPDRAEELADAMVTMMTQTSAEAGCIVYTYSRDIREPGRFHLSEIWENQITMDAHINASHSTAFVRRLNEFGRIVSVKAYAGDAQKFRIRSAPAG